MLLDAHKSMYDDNRESVKYLYQGIHFPENLAFSSQTLNVTDNFSVGGILEAATILLGQNK